MPPTYFDRSQNLQINGDVNLISNGGPSQDDTSFLQVTQRVQSANAKSRSIERGSQILCNNTAPSALYGYGHSFMGPQCHPGTRVAVQDYIFKWLNDPDGPIAMWMNGPVGIGKSAIAQTIAHKAAERDQLCSAFFFFRSDDTRNTTKNLVATLAYEMTQRMPRTLDPVSQTITANQLIFSYPLDRQINDILLHPLKCTMEHSSMRSRIMIIDGLDECLDPDTQQGIIQSFISSFLSGFTPPFPQKLLFVSRPESHIASAFSAMNISNHVQHLYLQSWNTEDDIGTFLHDKLKEIKNTHPMRHHLADLWPDKYSFCELRQRAVGSFAYASAVIRYLAPHKHNPECALQDILSLQPHRVKTAFTELDALYRHILSSLDPEICFTLLKVLCLYLYSRESDVTLLAHGLFEEQSAIEIVLIHIPSLVRFNSQRIELYHESFAEFLCDEERSEDHHVFSPNVATAVASSFSNFWLNPADGLHHDIWFSTIGDCISEADDSMNVYILRRLIATKIPPDIFTIEQIQRGDAWWFIGAIQQKFICSSDSTDGPLYNAAYDVVCVWLRVQLNAAFQGLPTLTDVLNIFMGTSQKAITFAVLYHFVGLDSDPFGFLCRLFPEMENIEICYGIVEYYLALSNWSRQIDVEGYDIDNISGINSRSLHRLYGIALEHPDAMVPNLCRQLEQLVLDGQYALNFTKSRLRTSKHSIFCILYGEPFDIDSMGRFSILQRENRHNSDIDWLWQEIVTKTDHYIRKVHARLEFPYISEAVEALYRVPPENFDLFLKL